jgi:hypothetical protein
VIKKMRWVEREFEFNLPIGVFPCVVERLRGTPARLEELTRGLLREELTAKPEGLWSMQEQAGHLLDLDELHEGRLEDYARGLEVLRAADMRNRKTEEAGHNASQLADILAAFRNARQSFVQRLEALTGTEVAATALHPRLQKQMRIIDMAYFTAEHDDHHLAAISELRRRG